MLFYVFQFYVERKIAPGNAASPPPPFSTALGGDKFRNKLKYLFTIISMQMLSEVNRGAWRLEVY